MPGPGSLRTAIQTSKGAGQASNAIILDAGSAGTITLSGNLPRLTQSATITAPAGTAVSGTSAAIVYGSDIETGKILTLSASLSVMAVTSNSSGTSADRAVGIGNSQIDDFARAFNLNQTAPVPATVIFADRVTGAISVTSARTGIQTLPGENPTTTRITDTVTRTDGPRRMTVEGFAGIQTLLSGGAPDVTGQYLADALGRTASAAGQSRWDSTALLLEGDVVMYTGTNSTLNAGLAGRFSSDVQDVSVNLTFRRSW